MVSRLLLVGILVLAIAIGAGCAQERRKASTKKETLGYCKEFAPPNKEVRGKVVGVEECEITAERVVSNIHGHKYRRVEIRISGTVDGWAIIKKGRRYTYFNDGPDFVFTQSGNTSKRFRGIGKYEASNGSGMTIFYPEDPDQWNGKLFVTAHGGGTYGAVGTLIPGDPNLKFNPLANNNRYVGLMIDKGYAVVHTLRSSSRRRGDITVTLDNGITLWEYNVSYNAGLMRDWIKLARNFLAKRGGLTPRRTYWYGFSAGGALGKLINYWPGHNRDDDGSAIIDGFIMDDSGGGLWFPELIIDGKDVLFARDEERKRFGKQIDITHQLYMGQTGDYLHNKRENTRLLREKGLGDKHRMYEIRGVSHFDAGRVCKRRDLVCQNLDMGGLMDALITLLDQWVEKDIPPPPTKSDTLELGDANKDGVNENTAVALPEIACPLGVYYTFPKAHGSTRRATQLTAFAAFDGVNLEPLDGRGRFVDMNANGVRDKRESVTQAWVRLGFLKQGQRFNRSKYVSCVANAASKLVDEGLLPPKVGAYYVEQAQREASGTIMK